MKSSCRSYQYHIYQGQPSLDDLMDLDPMAPLQVPHSSQMFYQIHSTTSVVFWTLVIVIMIKTLKQKHTMQMFSRRANQTTWYFGLVWNLLLTRSLLINQCPKNRDHSVCTDPEMCNFVTRIVLFDKPFDFPFSLSPVQACG